MRSLSECPECGHEFPADVCRGRCPACGHKASQPRGWDKDGNWVDDLE